MSRKRQAELRKRNRLLLRSEGLMARDVAKVIREIGDRMASRIGPGSNEALLELVDQATPDLAEAMRRRLVQTATIFGELNLDRIEAVVGEEAPKSATIHTDLAENVFGPVRGRLMAALEGKDFAEIFRGRVLEWSRWHSLQRAESINGTLKDQLRRVLAQGAEEGVGTDALGRMIRDRATGLSRTNAARIARTEAHTAANVGADEAARSTGLDMVKEWAAAEDSRTRATHAAADGDEVGKDEAFSVGADRLMFPGDPSGSAKEIINCRCTVLHHPVIGGRVLRDTGRTRPLAEMAPSKEGPASWQESRDYVLENGRSEGVEHLTAYDTRTGRAFKPMRGGKDYCELSPATISSKPASFTNWRSAFDSEREDG